MDQYISRPSSEGVEIKGLPPPMPTEEVRSTPTQAFIGLKNIELTNIGLCAIIQTESLRNMLLSGRALGRACYSVLRFVMESGAKGCEIIVSRKLRAQRAKSMKCKDVYMISAGQPVKDYIDSAVRYVFHRQGVFGIKVKIMLDWDPKGKQGHHLQSKGGVRVHQVGCCCGK